MYFYFIVTENLYLCVYIHLRLEKHGKFSEKIFVVKFLEILKEKSKISSKSGKMINYFGKFKKLNIKCTCISMRTCCKMFTF